MADESEIQEAASDAGKTSGQVIGASEAGGGKKYNLIDDLFSGGNKLLTLPGSSLVINDDTRRLLALFADGRFLVVESHKFDGRVLSFEVLARKKQQTDLCQPKRNQCRLRLRRTCTADVGH